MVSWVPLSETLCFCALTFIRCVWFFGRKWHNIKLYSHVSLFITLEPRLVRIYETFILIFEPSYVEFVITFVELFLCVKLFFMVRWWCIFCERYVCLILGMWQARTGTTGFDAILSECHVGCGSLQMWASTWHVFMWTCASSHLKDDDRWFT